MSSIKELREEFDGEGEVRGFRFRRVMSNGYAYIYRISSGSSRDYFEVFERKINAAYGVVRYPKSKSFGIWARTTYDFDKALEYYGEYSSRVMLREGAIDSSF